MFSYIQYKEKNDLYRSIGVVLLDKKKKLVGVRGVKMVGTPSSHLRMKKVGGLMNPGQLCWYLSW